jgi:hypothetical protein
MDSELEKRNFDGLMKGARKMFGDLVDEDPAAIEAVAFMTARRVPRFKGESFRNWFRRGLMDVIGQWSNS